MRVGLVYDDSLDGPDGVPQYVLHVGGWLRRQGHTVYYLVGETRRTDIPNTHSLSRNWHVRFNGNALSTPLSASNKRLGQLLRELKLDVLHVQTPYSPFMAGGLIGAADVCTAVVGTFHILPYSRVVRGLSIIPRLFNARTAKRFDAMMAVSVPAQGFAKSHYGFESTVVPNLFDLDRFISAKPRSRTKQLVYLGRLVPRKGPAELLRAVAWLVEQGQWAQGWSVRIGGKGQLCDALRSYCDAHGLSSIVVFDGFIAETDKAAFLAQADIAVFPSIAGESFGISLLEAFAAARGVVLGGDNPGYRSVMEGFEDQLFDPRATRAFAALLLRWMNDDAGRTAVAARQRKYVARFDADVVGHQILAVYNKALQKRRAACHN